MFHQPWYGPWSSQWDDDLGFDPFFDSPIMRGSRHHHPRRHATRQIEGSGPGDKGADTSSAEGGGQLTTQQQQQQQVGLQPRRRPRFEIHDDKDALVLRAETPGVPKENIKVSVHDGRLTVSGEEKQEQRGEGFFFSNFGAFEHSWTLPSHVDGDKLTANYNDGVLHVRLPKRPMQAPRQVSIS